MRVFLSAGEPSGDHHAALLARALRERCPDVECVGLGGPQMAAEGVELVADMTKLAVMWFLRVILSIHRFVDLARRAERSFLDHRPAVCVLVDFPGFHWWLAWRAKRHGIPVVFYCPPQIWAWASWRKEKMRRLVDHVLAPLPFEHDWFTAEGIASTLVGADASHAWLAAWGGDAGWLDVDPTNDCVVGDRHVTVAWGRDYGDVCPIRGVFVGGGQHGMDVAVHVTRCQD